jgi:hypothetical protein
MVLAAFMCHIILLTKRTFKPILSLGRPDTCPLNSVRVCAGDKESIVSLPSRSEAVRGRRDASFWPLTQWRLLRAGLGKVQVESMKTAVNLDDDPAAELAKTAALVGEKPATVIRLALRAGLPLVASRFQAPRPEGYFADTVQALPFGSFISWNLASRAELDRRIF